MTTAPYITLPPSDHAAAAGIRVGGDWTLAHYARLESQVDAMRTRLGADAQVDLSELGALDTAGASLLVALLGAARVAELAAGAADLSDERRALLQTVGTAMQQAAEPPPHPSHSTHREFFGHVGEVVEGIGHKAGALLGFVGMTLSSMFVVLLHPRRWRMTSLVSHLEQTGLNAVPIVALLTFLVGAVVAFLGATILADFGATIYTVDLVAFSFLREFGVLLTAILMAGRTASAFTAQIGSMKANEEIDAIRTLGLSPMELLVLPRVFAMLIALPLLTFIAMLSGITGGAMVCMVALDISPAMFLSIFQENIPINHFLVGMLKAPIFAFLIAVIGCLEGFKVTGSARSVGERTTSSVVQSIFVVILVDAVAALFLMEMGW
ncbi:ABC transporter permease [Phytopseudomonas dryadis]|uniref:ABC transporter permease n=1 Tax=Phytopseudomonas dryadis TaxID=2487520 RepID=A0A4V2KCC0_9GAMM|nr:MULTISPECIES: MlaE family lipid ABC transporter permease subunit [Pseudomonas]TBU92969.1 ABC transporter permease [Pseudomonas dryadis]TBV04713.1 ABC transporter permease [Pseudomonas dryadis]TBV17200.1 ABC transporter permease [Pseudomonas sp. FRB 230]